MKNMRKHNGNFLLFKKARKIMELLLLMVLFAKMAQGAVLVDVLAQDNDIASGTDWTLDADGKLTITSDAGMTDWKGNRSTYKSDVITIEISDGVSSIPNSAFTECRSLTAVAIPETVTSIGQCVVFGTGRGSQ